jgi:hypothetical protein
VKSNYKNVQIHFFDDEKEDPEEGSVELTETTIKYKLSNNTIKIMLEDLKSQRGVEYTRDVSDKNDESKVLESGNGIVIETFGDSGDFILTSETCDMKELQNNISEIRNSSFDGN